MSYEVDDIGDMKLTNHSETMHKTLEEIAAAFGDKLVQVDEQQVASEGLALEQKAASKHVEHRTEGA